MARSLLDHCFVRVLLTSLALATAACTAGPPAATTAPLAGSSVEVPLHFYVGMNRRGPVVDPEILGEWVGQAATDFYAAGFSFEVASVRYVDAASIDARTRRGRKGLAALGGDVGIHIAIAGPLGRPRKGAATRGSWLPRHRFVVLSTEASRTTLSHELGHAFGLDHESMSVNLMCSCDREPQAQFSKIQLAQAATAVARWHR